MSGLQLRETRMGRTLIDHTLPELVRQLARLNDLLERLVQRMPEQPMQSDSKEEGHEQE